MPTIAEEVPYDGVTERIARLGLGPLLNEVRDLITGYDLRVLETPYRNSGAAVRRMIDARFEARGGWVKKQTGDVDWTKCHKVNGTRVCVGVEVQVSGRSDLVAVDLIHLRERVITGDIDVGVLVVPDDNLSRFLTDRGPFLSNAKHHAKQARVADWPLLIIGFLHDGPGMALPKPPKSESKNRSKRTLDG